MEYSWLGKRLHPTFIPQKKKKIKKKVRKNGNKKNEAKDASQLGINWD